MLSVSEEPVHLSAFIAKMESEQLPGIVVDTFADYYRQVHQGATGMIPDREITALDPAELPAFDALDAYREQGLKARTQTVRIVLNGGLGTSMGLTGAKSLLKVKEGKSFLELILGQTQRDDNRLALMNSFNTHSETLAAVEKLHLARPPLTFLQHKFPKILREDLSPARYPSNPKLEWNPPGHGDVFTALLTSGSLLRLLDQRVFYAFISNSDNLGASLDPGLLGYFSQKRIPFMMEVAEKTPADVKGGHLARRSDGRLVLREAAQCPADELEAFRDIRRYRFFNTNNIWVDLRQLRDLFDREGLLRLPLIVNPKTLDPRDETSPGVYQIETAMGAAISLFEGAVAVRVPRRRFFPVKTCADLLAVRSDRFVLSPEQALVANPACRTETIPIRLDPKHFAKIDQFERRFPQGVPSLADCEGLDVEGDVFFESGVRMRGKVRIRNEQSEPLILKSGALLTGELIR